MCYLETYILPILPPVLMRVELRLPPYRDSKPEDNRKQTAKWNNQTKREEV
jgi:hypothetical protein